jgi:asparagine synthetase B (glutamine-hydrolysing)
LELEGEVGERQTDPIRLEEELQTDPIRLEEELQIRLEKVKQMRGESIRKVLERMQGEYAFVFYDVVTNQLICARDVLGRRSLLWCFKEKELILSSVGVGGVEFDEVPADGLYIIDLAVRSLL